MALSELFNYRTFHILDLAAFQLGQLAAQVFHLENSRHASDIAAET